jgi:chemosensory pili system protein ChpC
MSTPNTAIRSLLIPITGGQLLLPSAAVAEVIRYRNVDTPIEEPEWLLGVFTWRNQKVPLLSLEKFFAVQRQVIPEDPRIVILYGIHEGDSLPFYAFVSQAMPHTLAVKQSMLGSPKSASRAGLLGSVMLNEQQTGWMPDLAYLEKQVNQALE